MVDPGLDGQDESLTDDQPEVGSFFSRLLGRGRRVPDAGDSAPAVFRFGGNDVTGIMSHRAGLCPLLMSPRWIAYIAVDGAVAIAARVTALGSRAGTMQRRPRCEADQTAGTASMASS